MKQNSDENTFDNSMNNKKLQVRWTMKTWIHTPILKVQKILYDFRNLVMPRHLDKPIYFILTLFYS